MALFSKVPLPTRELNPIAIASVMAASSSQMAPPLPNFEHADHVSGSQHAPKSLQFEHVICGSAQSRQARVCPGAKRICMGSVAALVSTLLTQTGHKQAAFAAMHGFDLLYSAWSLGLGSSRCSGPSSLACSAATPPCLLHWPHEKTDWEKSHARDRSCFAQYRNNGFAAHRR